MISPEKRQNSLLAVGSGREGGFDVNASKKGVVRLRSNKKFPLFFPLLA